MYEIHKEFHWSMGHRISRHGGKCYAPHGHEYLCRVWLKSSTLDDEEMVMDYYKLTQIVNPIVDALDHAFMVYTEDKLMAWFFNSVNGSVTEGSGELSVEHHGEKHTFRMPLEDLPKPFKIILVPWESTAENIARYIFEQVQVHAPNVSKVEVWETRKCCAIYTPSPGFSQASPSMKISD